MKNPKDTQPKTKKPAGKSGGLFTVLCAALVVVGIGVIAYPFALIAIEEHNKNEVVAQLEKELPIHRAEEDFEMLDEAAIAAMPVVAVPQWTTEEVAAANALLEGDNAELIAERPIDAKPQTITMPPTAALPTEAPQPGVRVIYEDDLTAIDPGQSLIATLPDPPLDQAALSSSIDASAGLLAAQTGTNAQQSANSPQSAAVAAQSGTQAAQPDVAIAQSGSPLVESSASAVQPGLDLAQTSTSTQSVAVQTGTQTAQTSTSTQPVAAQTGTQTAQTSTSTQPAAAQTGTQTAQTSTSTQPVAAQTGTQTPADATSSAPNEQPAEPPVQPASQSNMITPVNEAGLPNIISPEVIEPTTDPQATQAVNPAGEAQPTVDPRTVFQLRDAAPVYYEDFARILDEANMLAAKMAAFTPRQDEQRKFDSPTELTVGSIKSQVNATTSLLRIFQQLPSVSSAFSAFQGEGGAHSVSLTEGGSYLATDLAALEQVVAQFTRLQRFPRARDLMQEGFDRSVQLADETLNLMDYMAQQLDSADMDTYLRSRSASLVGETEAAYLLELPSLRLKVGCFPNLTFEQMYKTMRKGAALYPRVGTPNTNTNISMICHRTGSAAFFKNIDKLVLGDTVLLHTRGLGSFRYVVVNLFSVDEDNWEPMHDLGYPGLTLISCEEFNGISHGKRIMAHCKLIGIAR